MEQYLDRPLRELIPIIQHRLLCGASYFGIFTRKFPLDFWIYREIITWTKPDVIIEIGTFQGGSALALAHVCDNVGHGRVITLDLDHSLVAPLVKEHPRITLIQGDAVTMLSEVKSQISSTDKVMVIEDSSHYYDQCLGVLEAYAPLVSVGQYFIVEDTICHHGLDGGPNPGPYEAVQTFLGRHPEFLVNKECEAFGLTWNPSGYLLKI